MAQTGIFGQEEHMLTFSEQILTVTVWVLAAAGLFFGLRAARRRRQRRREEDR